MGTDQSHLSLNRAAGCLRSIVTRMALVGVCGVAPIDEANWPSRLERLPPTELQWERTVGDASKVRVTSGSYQALVYYPIWSRDYLIGAKEDLPAAPADSMAIAWSGIDRIEKRKSTPFAGAIIGGVGGVGLTLLLMKDCKGLECMGFAPGALIMGGAGAIIGGLATGWPRWSAIYRSDAEEE